MTSAQEEDFAPEVRFKRRKITHNKRMLTEDGAAATSISRSPDAPLPNYDSAPSNRDEDDGESLPNLKEILRARRRLRDRFKEPVRRPGSPEAKLVPTDEPQQDQYTGRFVAQTGQVVDRDDKQMTEYVEARIAEQNFRKYGWPIPRHLQATVVAIASDLKHAVSDSPPTPHATSTLNSAGDVLHSQRLAAGKGKLQEVDLGPDAAARVEKHWKQLEAGEPEDESAHKSRKAKYGYQWRRAKRRDSDAERRDQMVEAILHEAKLDYFDETMPTNSRLREPGSNNDDAVAESFRAEYYEAMEQHRRRRAHPPASGTKGTKGAKETRKGPKLGGSKSARAKMRLQEEQAGKSKR